MTFDEIITHFNGWQKEGIKRNGGDRSVVACCPAHGDKHPSLHITEKGDKVLLKCFSQDCTVEHICSAAGLKVRDLYLHPKQQQTAADNGVTLEDYAAYLDIPLKALVGMGCYDATYSQGRVVRMPYFSADGQPIAERIRLHLKEPKSKRFLWERRKFSGIVRPKRLLYGLERLQQFTQDYVVLAEGESDTQLLTHLGFQALGIPGGGEFDPQYWTEQGIFDRFRHIYVPIEPDGGGEQLYNSCLVETNRLINRFRFPCIRVDCCTDTPCKDPCDLWHSLKGTPDREKAFSSRFWAILEKTYTIDQLRPYFPPKAAKSATAPGKQSDSGGRPKANYFGLAKVFLEGLPTLKYYAGMWYVHQTDRYVPMGEDEEELRARIMAFLEESPAPDIYGVKPCNNAVNEVIAVLKSANYCFLPSRLKPPFLVSEGREITDCIVCRNGLLNAKKAGALFLAHWQDREKIAEQMDMLPLSPDVFNLRVLPVDFDPYACNDKLMSAWQSAFRSEDPGITGSLAALMCQMYGLSLIPDRSKNVVWFLQGPPGTGKTTVGLQPLMALLGEENRTSIKLQSLADRFGLEDLLYKTANICDELPSEMPYDRRDCILNVLKNITGGGELRVDRKGKTHVQGKATAQCVYCCNLLPQYLDKALLDRVIIIPFSVRFRATPEDKPGIAEEITADLPGVLNWALWGIGMAYSHDGNYIIDSKPGRDLKTLHYYACNPGEKVLRQHWSHNPQALPGNDELKKKVYESYCQLLAEGGHKKPSDDTFERDFLNVFGFSIQNRATIRGLTYFPTEQDLLTPSTAYVNPF